MIVGGRVMTKKSNWESMTIEELFTLRELMQDVLVTKFKNRHAELQRKLRTLNQLQDGVEPTPVLLAAE